MWSLIIYIVVSLRYDELTKFNEGGQAFATYSHSQVQPVETDFASEFLHRF